MENKLPTDYSSSTYSNSRNEVTAKARREELLCWLRELGDFAPLREIPSLFQQFLHGFLAGGKLRLVPQNERMVFSICSLVIAIWRNLLQLLNDPIFFISASTAAITLGSIEDRGAVGGLVGGLRQCRTIITTAARPTINPRIGRIQTVRLNP